VGINESTISNSYATGSVTGSASFIGGLVGDNTGGTVTSSFWNMTTSGQATSAGGSGAVGLTTAQMMEDASFSAWGSSISDTGGSNATWRIYEGKTAPLLRSFLTALTVTADNVTKASDNVTATLANATYSVSGAASSVHLFNLSNPYDGAINVGSYTPDLYSDQQGYDISYVNGTLTITAATASSGRTTSTTTTTTAETQQTTTSVLTTIRTDSSTQAASTQTSSTQATTETYRLLGSSLEDRLATSSTSTTRTDANDTRSEDKKEDKKDDRNGSTTTVVVNSPATNRTESQKESPVNVSQPRGQSLKCG
jgi:hypothetical protein